LASSNSVLTVKPIQLSVQTLLLLVQTPLLAELLLLIVKPLLLAVKYLLLAVKPPLLTTNQCLIYIMEPECLVQKGGPIELLIQLNHSGLMPEHVAESSRFSSQFQIMRSMFGNQTSWWEKEHPSFPVAMKWRPEREGKIRSVPNP
jgi:hypothetical protein